MGSSIITTFALNAVDLAIATACLCPPESSSTFWSALLTLIFNLSKCASVNSLIFLKSNNFSNPKFLVGSLPKKIFSPIGRLPASARSWYTISNPKF